MSTSRDRYEEGVLIQLLLFRVKNVPMCHVFQTLFGWIVLEPWKRDTLFSVDGSFDSLESDWKTCKCYE